MRCDPALHGEYDRKELNQFFRHLTDVQRNVLSVTTDSCVSTSRCNRLRENTTTIPARQSSHRPDESTTFHTVYQLQQCGRPRPPVADARSKAGRRTRSHVRADILRYALATAQYITAHFDVNCKQDSFPPHHRQQSTRHILKSS